MKNIIKNTTILSILLVALPSNAVPASAWRTRSTSLSTRKQCVERAFDAMEKAGLNELRLSGADNMAVYGKTEQTVSYIVCENGGSLAAIFCSSYNYTETTDICNYIAAYMKK